MSYPNPPPRPTAGPEGSTPELLFMQTLWDIHWDPRVNLFSDHPRLKFSKTTRGYIPRLRIPPTKSVSHGGDASFQGVYTPGSYDAMQWVVVQSGPVFGAYISTADGNTNAPWTGINWVNFSSLNQWF